MELIICMIYYKKNHIINKKIMEKVVNLTVPMTVNMLIIFYALSELEM